MKQIFIFLLLMLVTFPGYMLEVGDRAPTFVNPDLQVKYIFSKNVIGESWVILDFFATDCDGCKKELPELEELYQEFKDNGLIILVFAVDEEGPHIVKPYFDEHPTELCILIDRYKKTAITYNVTEIPSLFLINPEGVIVLHQVEYSEDNVPDIKAILLKAILLKDEGDTTKEVESNDTEMNEIIIPEEK